MRIFKEKRSVGEHMNMQARTPHIPAIPMTIAATGLNPVFARDILIKTMFRKNVSTPTRSRKQTSVARAQSRSN